MSELTPLQYKILQMKEEQAMRFLMPDEKVIEPMTEMDIIRKTGPMGAEVLDFLKETIPTLYKTWLSIGKMYPFVQRRVQEARELRTTIENQQNLEFFKKNPEAEWKEQYQARERARQIAMETVRSEVLFRPVKMMGN